MDGEFETENTFPGDRHRGRDTGHSTFGNGCLAFGAPRSEIGTLCSADAASAQSVSFRNGDSPRLASSFQPNCEELIAECFELHPAVGFPPRGPLIFAVQPLHSRRIVKFTPRNAYPRETPACLLEDLIVMAETVIALDMIRETLYTAVICDALDSLGLRRQSPRVPIKPLTGCEKLVGRAKTTLWADMFHVDPKPYELELIAVDSCQPDDVMVCAAGGSLESGVWGELLSTAARNSGCVGVIVDGAVRDVAKMREMGFPCFARATCMYDSQNRQRVIDIGVAVEIDGVKIESGDLVMADLDGVVVVPQAVEIEAIQRAWNKVHAENVTRDAIKQGMKAVAAYEKYGVL